METLLEKIKVIQWYYKEILENFFEIISVKLGKIIRNLITILKNYKKHFTQTLKTFWYNFVKFSRQFLGEFTINCTESTNNFREKLQRNPKEIMEIFQATAKWSDFHYRRMCQIMRFSLYCINGSIEGRRIDKKNSNNAFLVWNWKYTHGSFSNWCICPLSTMHTIKW